MDPAPADGYVVTPHGRGRPLRELWAARGLLAAFAGREVRVRYRQAVLGAAWAVVQPLALTAACALVFRGVLGAGSEGLAYAPFAMVGLVAWVFFQGVVTAATPSLVQNANLVRKTWFPRETIPLGCVAAGLLDLLLGLVAAVGLAAAHGVVPAAALLWAPVHLAVLVALASACALAGAGVNARFRDVKHALPLLLQVLFFATPVVYPRSAAPDAVAGALLWNPLTGVVEGLRAALLHGRAPEVVPTAVSAAGAGALLVLAWVGFKRADRRFADFV